MSLAETVLKKIDSGEWIFDSVTPPFRRQLLTSFGEVESVKSTSELCLAHYRRLPVEAVSISTNKKIICRSETSAEFMDSFRLCFAVKDEEAEFGEFDEPLRRKLQFALEVIEVKCSKLSTLVDRSVLGFVYSPNSAFRSASHPHLFGIIGLGKRVEELTCFELATSIIHEAAHQELFLMNLLDRLVNKPFDYNEVHSPLQGKLRPPIARLHSMWALMRMVQFQKMYEDPSETYRRMLVQNIETFSNEELTLTSREFYYQLHC